ncbi:molybdopterin converting factor subunit 1 [Sphingomonas sp.]|jgi:molybdopterin synthase sulfur carrier subunit|uniref:molybdopterin converting factor subunit 1 n=1 Tax=Sphingomonas sp. TaxID=28214 RepID=UPI002E34A4CE|nr:molybdopterin converting factor subunit 1 [Sphingomonas sp.]HEX4694807.1 molybdopterin converting factor subunit 1 [Sphingomonas sp.]
MALQILYFAWVREKIGRGEETIVPPDHVATVRDLIVSLTQRGGGYAEALGDVAKLRAAIDQQFVPLDAPIGGAREVAIFPPVTGG